MVGCGSDWVRVGQSGVKVGSEWIRVGQSRSEWVRVDQSGSEHGLVPIHENSNMVESLITFKGRVSK